jgi:hypothetical protein
MLTVTIKDMLIVPVLLPHSQAECGAAHELQHCSCCAGLSLSAKHDV